MTSTIIKEIKDPRLELITDACYFYQQGWMLGTAGNLSARLPNGSFWITASGISKGNLLKSNFVRIASDGTVEESASDLKPSAETSIHQLVYRLFPEAQACYHIHSIDSNLVSRLVAGDSVTLPPLEMIKGLGVWRENPCCVIPIFTNHLKVSQITADIEKRFAVTPPQIPALLIRDHGLTIWASSLEKSRNYIELLEYIFRYMVITSRLNINRFSDK